MRVYRLIGCLVGLGLGWMMVPAQTFYGGDILLKKVEEVKAKTSYRNNSGSLASGTKHVAAVTIGVYGGWSTGETGGPTASYLDPSDVYTSYDYPEFGYAVVEYPETAAIVPHTTYRQLFVANATENAANTFSCASQPIASGGGNVAGLTKGMTLGEEAVLHVASDGSLSGATIQLVVTYTKSWYVQKELHWHMLYVPGYPEYGYEDLGVIGYSYEYHEETKHQRFDVPVAKLLCYATNIDTRKLYGQPNLDGQITGDANAESSNVNFNGWTFKGGHFVGNMPSSTGDLSGTARIQLYPQGGSVGANSKIACLSLLHLGAPASATGDLTIAAYFPSGSDPNISTAYSSTVWSNGWVKANMTEISNVTLGTGTGLNEYINWRLNAADLSSLSSSAASKIALAMQTENTATQAWRYFATAAYQGLSGMSFPITDSQPRVWLCDRVVGANW